MTDATIRKAIIADRGDNWIKFSLEVPELGSIYEYEQDQTNDNTPTLRVVPPPGRHVVKIKIENLTKDYPYPGWKGIYIGCYPYDCIPDTFYKKGHRPFKKNDSEIITIPDTVIDERKQQMKKEDIKKFYITPSTEHNKISKISIRITAYYSEIIEIRNDAHAD